MDRFSGTATHYSVEFILSRKRLLLSSLGGPRRFMRFGAKEYRGHVGLFRLDSGE